MTSSGRCPSIARCFSRCNPARASRSYQRIVDGVVRASLSPPHQRFVPYSLIAMRLIAESCPYRLSYTGVRPFTDSVSVVPFRDPLYRPPVVCDLKVMVLPETLYVPRSIVVLDCMPPP